MGIYWTGEEYPQERESSRPSRESLSSKTFSAIARARGSRPESARCEGAHLRTRVEQFRRRVEDELNDSFDPSEVDAYRSVLLWLHVALNGPVVPSIMLDEEEALYERK